MIRGSRCEDCGPRCEVCDRTAYCWSEQTAPPCNHDRPLCEGCRLEACPECRREAFADMAESGDYDPCADPWYRPEREAVDAERLEAQRLETFDPKSNQYRSTP